MSSRVALAFLILVSGNARAQEPLPPSSSRQPSPITDLIEKAKNSLNNLQYTQARTTAREVLALGRLKRTQEMAALEVAAAAYFPDDDAARRPDSASYYLRRLARMMPSGALPADLVSPGLDSAFVIARQQTFGATARVPIEITLRGTELRPAIEVDASRPTRWQLFLVTADGGPPILVDTLSNANFGRLSLRAHSGYAPLIQPGNYRLRIIAISMSEPDSIVMQFDMAAKGAVPTLVDIPRAPDPSRFLPERSPKAVGAGVAGGIIVGGATWALANLLRPPKALGDEKKDGRGTVVAASIGVGALLAGLLDRGKPNLANIKANADTRSDYIKRLGDATETNRKRIGEYALALTIDPEIK